MSRRRGEPAADATATGEAGTVTRRAAEPEADESRPADDPLASASRALRWRRAWRRRPVRLAVAALLVLGMVGVQVWLARRPVAVSLPAENAPGTLTATSGVEALVLQLKPSPDPMMLARTSADIGLARVDFERAMPSPDLVNVIEAARRSASEEPEAMGYRRAGEAGQSCPASLRLELPASQEPQEVWIYGDRAAVDAGRSCELQLRLPSRSELVVETSVGDLGAERCWRMLWSASDAAGFRVQDPLVARFTLPEGDVARMRFEPGAETDATAGGTCSPLTFTPDIVALAESRRLSWSPDAIQPSLEDERAPSVRIVADPSGDQGLDLRSLEMTNEQLTLEPTGVGWVRERGRLVTSNRLQALYDNQPLATTFGVLVQLGLYAWIARLFVRRPENTPSD